MNLLNHTGKLPFSHPSSMLDEPSVPSPEDPAITGGPSIPCYLSFTSIRLLNHTGTLLFPNHLPCSLNPLSKAKLPWASCHPRVRHSLATSLSNFTETEARESYSTSDPEPYSPKTHLEVCHTKAIKVHPHPKTYYSKNIQEPKPSRWLKAL